jgi:hypothetical protein
MGDALPPSWLLARLFKLVLLRAGLPVVVLLIHQEVEFLIRMHSWWSEMKTIR